VKLSLTFVVACALACLLGASMESESGHVASAITESPPPHVLEPELAVFPAPRKETGIELASFPKPGDEKLVSKPAVPQSSVSPREAAAFCDALDLVERPDLADDMVRIAGATYGTPPGLLNGIWETESDHDIDGQTDPCSVTDQYEIRDCWKPGTTTRRPAGCRSPYVFVGETPGASRWKRPPSWRKIGNGTEQKLAIARLGKALGFDPSSVRGSCGNRTLYGLRDPSGKPTFGGCFGNMQITPSEWEDDAKAMGFGISELSPFDLCDSMLVSSYRLRKHHDERLKRYAKRVGESSLTAEHDQLSWLWAGRRYYGSPEKVSTNRYEYHFKWGRGNPRHENIFTFRETHPRQPWKFPCGWKCWDDMATRDDFSPLVEHVRWRAGKIRSRRSYASN